MKDVKLLTDELEDKINHIHKDAIDNFICLDNAINDMEDSIELIKDYLYHMNLLIRFMSIVLAIGMITLIYFLLTH